MEGTLRSEWAQAGLPVPRLLLLPPELSPQTGHALMTDVSVQFSYSLKAQPCELGVYRGMGVPATGWAFLVAKGTRSQHFKFGVVYAWTAGCTLPLPAHRPASVRPWSSELT